MSTLQDRLDQISADFEKQAPAAALTIMHDETEALITSGLHKRALGVGAEFPEFRLEDSKGSPIDSGDFLGQGPVIINFFRGFW